MLFFSMNDCESKSPIAIKEAEAKRILEYIAHFESDKFSINFLPVCTD